MDILYLYYTGVPPRRNNLMTATSADNATIFAMNNDSVEATILLQNSLHNIEKCIKSENPIERLNQHI